MQSGSAQRARTGFQSLLGFLMRCDYFSPRLAASRSSAFQSLLGFLMCCDRRLQTRPRRARRVSIPAGFSDALRHSVITIFASTIAMFQSLLGFLMRCDVTNSATPGLPEGFQSLLGFLMRCDEINLVIEDLHKCVVSIPAGFSDALRPNAMYLEKFACDEFQSLLGFLMRCDSIVGSPYQPNRRPKSPEIRDSNHEPPLYHALINAHDRLNLPPVRTHITFSAVLWAAILIYTRDIHKIIFSDHIPPL